MTVTYTAEVATCRGFGCFVKLLFRWRGSIYKLVWPDLMLFLVIYYVLNFVYRLVLEGAQKKAFENLVQYCETFNDLIPISFVLGFYVSVVMTRWWSQYTSIPWPDPIAVFVSSNIHGQDERGRVMRRTIMRYVCLCLTMVLTMISPRVKKRFPTLEHFVEAGLLTDNERMIMNDLNEKFPRHSKHWMPIIWAASIVTRARKEGRIRDDFAVKTIIDELNKFRGLCGLLLSYDSISVPLVYTQVVSLAVYSYFITCVLGRQWLDINDEHHPLYKHSNSVDIYFPVFTTLEFFFYMGWLKVAETLINPFGEDDDDFEVNWLIDRNLQVAYMIVDEMHHEHPELIKDQYWEQVFPSQLPYTIASEHLREEHPQASTDKIVVNKSQAEQTILVDDPNPKDMTDDDSVVVEGVRRVGSSAAPLRQGSSIVLLRDASAAKQQKPLTPCNTNGRMTTMTPITSSATISPLPPLSIDPPRKKFSVMSVSENDLYDDEYSLYDQDNGIQFTAGGKRPSVARSISRVSTRERIASGRSAVNGSQTSLNNAQQTAGSMNRVASVVSVTNVLRRLFSRDGQPSGQQNAASTTPTNLSYVLVDGGGGGDASNIPLSSSVPGSGHGLKPSIPTSASSGRSIPMSQSGTSLSSKFLGGGSMRIADQVIEEVDEQSTIQSIRPPDNKPNVRDIFPTGPPPPSSPVDVPITLSHDYPYSRGRDNGDEHILASSAPPYGGGENVPLPSTSPSRSIHFPMRSAPAGGGRHIPTDTTSVTIPGEGDVVSIGSSTEHSDDEFSRLKTAREKERKKKFLQKIARSISAQTQAQDMDNELLLMDITPASPRSSVFSDANV